MQPRNFNVKGGVNYCTSRFFKIVVENRRSNSKTKSRLRASLAELSVQYKRNHTTEKILIPCTYILTSSVITYNTWKESTLEWCQWWAMSWMSATLLDKLDKEIKQDLRKTKVHGMQASEGRLYMSIEHKDERSEECQRRL